MSSLREKAESFANMHEKGGSLLLPNAWDAASARLFEEAGFPAIATTSSGVAFTHGYPDGQRITRDEMLQVVGRIARAVQVPVTADVEAGYGKSPDDVAKTVRGVIEAGAVGINLEDNNGFGNPLFTPEQQSARIAAGREAANQAGIPLVINARTDVYLFQVGEESTRLEETIKRGKAYLAAGATCFFIPGMLDPAIIEVLVREIPGGVSLMAGVGAPPASELFKLGVVRVSVGGAVMQATMGYIRDIARELQERGTFEQMKAHPYTHGDATKLFVKPT